MIVSNLFSGVIFLPLSSFTRSAALTFTAPDSGDDVVNDLDNESFFAMASTGVTDDEGKPQRHTKAAVSAQEFDFSA